MMKTVHGTVHGRTIQLDQDLGVADGQEVEIQVKLISSPPTWGAGILSAAGGWAEFPEMDAVFEKIYAQRQVERRSISLTTR
jgi:hypothetical protein